MPAGAAETFDNTVDRFEVDGNVNGPLDGTPDLVEEFDDGTLAPWHVRAGTATESAGLLHVQSPGRSTSLPGIFPVPFDASAAGINGILQAGSGDAVLRVVIPEQAIGANDGMSFDFSTIEGNAFYYYGVVLTNFNSTLANRFTPPYPIGLAATAHAERISFTNESLAAEHHVIAPGSVTWPIVLELRYDDATRHVTPAISVDGGSTYAFVFAPLEVETDSGAITVQTAVAAYAARCPESSGLQKARINGLRNPPGQQRMKLQLAFPSDVIWSDHFEPLRLLVTDDGAAGATVFDITLPDGTTAFQHACDPRDAWSGGGYVNRSNALPPACVPGSAQGLRKIRMRWNGTLAMRVVAQNSSIPSVTGPLRVTIYDGTGPVNECDGWTSAIPCRISSSTVRCDL